MDRIKEQIAHLIRVTEELSDVVAKQDATLAMLNRRVQLLMEREAEREAREGGGESFGDDVPPHY
ncbi:MAG: SlyX family protein [Pseudomonadota bacterium]